MSITYEINPRARLMKTDEGYRITGVPPDLVFEMKDENIRMTVDKPDGVKVIFEGSLKMFCEMQGYQEAQLEVVLTEIMDIINEHAENQRHSKPK